MWKDKFLSTNEIRDGDDDERQRDHGAGGVKRANHLGKAQVLQRRADEHGARDRPEEDEGLPVLEAERDRQQPVQEERAEEPGGEVGLREPTPRPHRQDDGDRAGGREDEADEAVGGVDAAKVFPEPAHQPAGPRAT